MNLLIVHALIYYYLLLNSSQKMGTSHNTTHRCISM